MDTFSRYFFIVVNVFFVALGILLLGFAIWLQNSSPLREMLIEEYTSRVVSYSVLILGCVILFVALCGVLGGVFQKSFLLLIYVIAIVLMLILVLVFFAYGLANKDVLADQSNNVWDSLNNETKYVIQNRFNCCGFWNYSDWNDTPLHSSCIDTTIAGSVSPWQAGCYSSILKWVDQNSLVFGLVVGFLFFFMVLQSVITVYLLWKKRKERTKIDKKPVLTEDDEKSLTGQP